MEALEPLPAATPPPTLSSGDAAAIGCELRAAGGSLGVVATLSTATLSAGAGCGGVAGPTDGSDREACGAPPAGVAMRSGLSTAGKGGATAIVTAAAAMGSRALAGGCLPLPVFLRSG